ncbi:MAG TPA: hypothetical protein VKZ87_02940 [Ferrovibrio sp.]|jgi:hypothetical protein|uniref:hypothetical protein n=1 Tax=Ferrovibrio sp. TaxID=1917215 RepID=UPI002B4AFF08|nr:hypothetical protein [Ferrovibrio sp.]HLT76321.1 hypothetical protein [Ferrovibrio sp.]
MSEAYVIEAAGEAAGLVVRQSRQSGGGFRFFASLPRYAALDQQVFRRADDAARAARALGSANDNRPLKVRRPS